MPRDRDMEPLITKTEGDNTDPRKADPNKVVDSFFYMSIFYVSTYLAVGSILYHFVFTLKDNTSKDADYVDTLYFCLVTLTTVGYGDYHPHDDGGKLFTCAYILFGLGFIAYCLSYFVDKILAKQEEIVVKTIERNTHALMSDDEAHHKIHHLCCFSIRSREDKRLILSSIWLLVLVSVGIIVYDRVDDRTNFIESLYFVTVSISTVGYGDVSPDTTTTKIFSIVWLALTTLSFANTISAYIEYSSNRTIEKLRYKLIHKKIDLLDFNRMDENRDGILSKYEWLRYQIIEGKYPVDENDINEIMDRYDQLDKDSNGQIMKSDLGI